MRVDGRRGTALPEVFLLRAAPSKQRGPFTPTLPSRRQVEQLSNQRATRKHWNEASTIESIPDTTAKIFSTAAAAAAAAPAAAAIPTVVEGL